MNISCKNLVKYCDQLLNVQQFNDFCPNGLQVEGCQHIERIITGVTACRALIDRAIELNADAILVHHGYFWKGEKPTLTGIKGSRIKKLMQHNINLLAYHLPLDAHPTYGNNAQLANKLDFVIDSGLDSSEHPVGFIGRPKTPLTVKQLTEKIDRALSRKPLVIGSEEKVIHQVAWCTGAAQSMVSQAAGAAVDCYITGEISEQTVHAARELDVVFIAAGHHATERYGVKALGQHLQTKFNLNVTFVDIDNPV